LAKQDKSLNTILLPLQVHLPFSATNGSPLSTHELVYNHSPNKRSRTLRQVLHHRLT